MRTKYISAIFILLLAVNLISAVEIKLIKDSYQPRETLQAEITGNFLTLSKENVQLYKEGIPRSTPVISGFTRFEDTYYFYAILPNQEGNFSLRIQNAQYTDSGVKKSEDIIKYFTIIKTNESSLSIDPGFVLTSDTFSIKIKSLNKNQEIDAELEANNKKNSFSLKEEVEKTVYFSISNINSTKTNLKINNYNIPVFIRNRPENIITPLEDLIFSPSELRATLLPSTSYSFQIILENIGNEDLRDIKVSNDFNAKIQPSLFNLNESERIYLNLSFLTTENAKDNQTLEGNVIAETQGRNYTMPVLFKITTNKSNEDLGGSSYTESSSCSDLGGNVCLDTQDCDGDFIASLERSCCRGNCVEIEAPAGYGWVYATVLILIVLGLIGYVFWKSKQRSFKNSSEILNKRAKSFEERMNPKSNHVEDRLDKY